MAGIISNDRKKGARVRNLLLDEVIKIFEMDPLKMSEGEIALKKDLLLRMAPNTLPRLTEVTGEGGEALIIQIAKEVAVKNEINESDTSPSTNSEEQAQISDS